MNDKSSFATLSILRKQETGKGYCHFAWNASRRLIELSQKISTLIGSCSLPREDHRGNNILRIERISNETREMASVTPTDKNYCIYFIDRVVETVSQQLRSLKLF